MGDQEWQGGGSWAANFLEIQSNYRSTIYDDKGHIFLQVSTLRFCFPGLFILGNTFSNYLM